jgi:tetratricopeptide (TPR) repeat protein
MVTLRRLLPYLAVLMTLTLGGCGSPETRAQADYDRGVKLLEQGDLVKASLEFRSALKRKNGFVPALYSLGLVAEQQGRLADAVNIFKDVADRAPDNVDARLHLGYIFAALGQLDDSEKFANEVEKLASGNPELLALKAGIALKRDNRGDAVQFADAALKIAPTNLHALLVRGGERLLGSDPAGALKFLDQAIKNNDRDLGLQVLRIRAFDALKDKSGVESVLLKLVSYYPHDQAFAIALARFYIGTERKADAEKALRAFAEVNPQSTEAEFSLVDFVGQAKGLDAARTELQAKIDKGGKVFPYRKALADLMLAGGKYDEAVDLMRKLIVDAGDTTTEGADAKVHLAQIMVKKDPAASRKLIDGVIAADPKNVDAVAVRASLQVVDGQVTSAIEDLRAALNQQPESPVLLQLLGDAYERNGVVTLAEEQLAKAYKVTPDNPSVGLNYVQFLLRYGKSEPAERILTEMRAKAPTNTQVLAELAQLRLARQDWVGAQEVSDSLRKLGNSSAADQIAAASLNGKGKFADSLKILESQPSTDQASLTALSRTYVQAGKPEKAEELLKSALTARPNDVQARLLLASLYQATNRTDEAEATYRSVIESDPNNGIAYAAMAEFYGTIGRLDSAEKTARDGLARVKDDRSLQFILANVLIASGQHEAAISAYETLFAADPRWAIVANNLASLLSEYRTDQASTDRAFAIASRFKDSGVPQYLDTLGWTYYLKGQYSEALALLKSAAEKLPKVASVQYHLGMAYKEVGQNDLAQAKLKEAIAIIPPPAPEQMERAQAALKQLASSAADQAKGADQ